MICSICGRSAPCEISQATKRPWCKACQKRRARCADCGQVELIRGGTLVKPLCAACTRPDPSFWKGCPACGHPQLSTQSCTRCNLRQRLRVLLADRDGHVRAELRGLRDNLADSERPNLVLAWLSYRQRPARIRHRPAGCQPCRTRRAPAQQADRAPARHPGRQHKLTSLEIPATRWQGPVRTIATKARWAQARWPLHDHTVNPVDRVAGLLVLLYAQTPAAVSRLTLEHVKAAGHAVHLFLGREPVALPEPLAGLIVGLLARRRGHAALGDHKTSPWRFPGGRPGQPISAYQLAERMRQLRLRPAQSRTTALFGLATELPAAVLVRLLGIHIKVAVEWQHASAGDWATYAADYSRRQPLPAQDAEPAQRHANV